MLIRRLTNSVESFPWLACCHKYILAFLIPIQVLPKLDEQMEKLIQVSPKLDEQIEKL